MTFRDLVGRGGKLIADNSPLILTAIGVTGTITTAYLAARASLKIGKTIGVEPEYYAERSGKEKFEEFWKLYIPVAASGALTIAAIVGANRIGTRRAAAMAAAFTIVERSFDEYKTKVVEKLGEKKEQAVRDEIAQDQINKRPASSSEIIVTGRGKTLCRESFTDRYFESDMETIRKAQNDLNAQIIKDGYASLSDLYDLLGLPHTSQSNEVGWKSDKLLEINFSGALNDGTPCISLEYVVTPVRHYSLFG